MKTRTLAALLLVLSSAVAPGLGFQEAPPPARERYRGREIARTMHYAGAPWLVRESRERQEECSRLLAALEVEVGDVVCDLGCGNGFYTLPLAERVGDSGRVLAVDIQPEMLELLGQRADAAGLSERIEPILGLLHDPRLPEGELDLVLMVDVYHELSHPELVLRAVRESLAPGGRLVLAEFREEDPAVPIKPRHKMSKVQVLRELVPNGYRLAREFDALPWQHLLFFERARVDERAQEAREGLARAAAATRALAVHGGYVGIHDLQTGERYGEALTEKADHGEVWVQPPGTPSVGAVFLRGFRATGQDGYLDAARAAGRALAWGQRKAGGWDHLVDVSSLGPADRAPVRRAGHCSFDDGISQGALRFLIELDALLDEQWLSESIEVAIGHHLRAQREDGAWPQWYPLRGGYHDLATFNDGVTNDCVDVLLLAADRYGRADCYAAALKGGDAIRALQLDAPQAGWAQQYDAEGAPAPARAFEPAAVCSAVTARNLRTLIELHERTGDARFLEPLQAAIAWLERSRMEDGRWARLYELETNRPIYADRDGTVHYDLAELSAERAGGYAWHGSWGIEATIAAARRALRGEAAPRAERGPPSPGQLAAARLALASLDDAGRWVRAGAVHASDFVRNAGALLELLEAPEE